MAKVNLALVRTAGFPGAARRTRPAAPGDHRDRPVDRLPGGGGRRRPSGPVLRPAVHGGVLRVGDRPDAGPARHPRRLGIHAVRTGRRLVAGRSAQIGAGDHRPVRPQRAGCGAGLAGPGPPELEERFGLTGGDIFHGALMPEQSFGARFAYRTPVPGLYLCGSGASPGGCVMGAAGRNCAAVVLEDLAGR